MVRTQRQKPSLLAVTKPVWVVGGQLEGLGADSPVDSQR